MTHSIQGSDVFTSYLFAYFTGNDSAKGQESIYFALSNDAHQFKALNNGKPILSSIKISLSGGIRDPHILRGENNDYYMVATDMVSKQGWASNRGMVLLKSNNLVDWEHNTVNIQNTFPMYAAVDRVWAPQTIYDPVAKKYMVYFSMRLGGNDPDKIYYAYTNSEFTKLETEPKLLFTYKSLDKILPSIDGDVIYKDSTYHLFFKTEQNGDGIKKATSKTLTGPYTLFDKYLQATTAAVEGSCVFKLINSDKYVLMYDVYKLGKYEFALSTDLKTFTLDPQPITFDFTPRHGTVLPITDKEKWALYAKWDPTSLQSFPKKPRLTAAPIVKNGSLHLPGGAGSKGVVSIHDISGREVLHTMLAGTTNPIALPRLSAGVYELRYRTDTHESTHTRFIVW